MVRIRRNLKYVIFLLTLPKFYAVSGRSIQFIFVFFEYYICTIPPTLHSSSNSFREGGDHSQIAGAFFDLCLQRNMSHLHSTCYPKARGQQCKIYLVHTSTKIRESLHIAISFLVFCLTRVAFRTWAWI